MSWLNPVPLVYRWLALAALAAVLLAFAFMKGVEHQEGVQARKDLAEAQATAKLTKARVVATNAVGLKYAPALTEIRTVTKETIRYVDRFIKPTDCPVSGGFRLLHDAAAEGRVPDPAGLPDAAPAPAKEVAATVADNYGSCLENAKRLEGLQEWVREQQRLNPGS